MQDIEHARRILKDNDVAWVYGQFVDLMGNLRSFSTPVSTYFEAEIWRDGIGFDGSSVKGFATVDQSDMIAIPDPKTMLSLPWLPKDNWARVVMDVMDVNSNQPFSGDPRHIARTATELVSSSGYDTLRIAPEFEFHIFSHQQTDQNRMNFALYPSVLNPVGNGGYFAPPSQDIMEPYRTKLSNALIESGINVKYHHHEGGTWQHEVEIFPLANAIQAADVTVLFKFMAQTLGIANDLLISFMPKPVQTEAGSGMHVHVELMKDKTSVFYDQDDCFKLSQTARYFIGGILDHAAAMAAITNPTVNSYKRLVPHYEAPIHIAWGAYNRSSLVRIPNRAGKNESIDIEVRHPDPSANPYLAFSTIIHAGIDGIKKKQDPGSAIEKNIYAMTPRELKAHNIKTLPRTLKEALDALASDQVIQESLGHHATQTFIEFKEREWNDFLGHVSSWDYRHNFLV